MVDVKFLTFAEGGEGGHQNRTSVNKGGGGSKFFQILVIL